MSDPENSKYRVWKMMTPRVVIMTTLSSSVTQESVIMTTQVTLDGDKPRRQADLDRDDARYSVTRQ